MSLVAVLAVIYGVKHAVMDGLGRVAVLGVVAGLLVGALFVRRQQVFDDPLIQPRLFRVPAVQRLRHREGCRSSLPAEPCCSSRNTAARPRDVRAGAGPMDAAVGVGVRRGLDAPPVLMGRFSAVRVVSEPLVLAAAGPGRC